jgi:hypothetical protein
MKKVIKDVISLIQEQFAQTGKARVKELQPIPVINSNRWQK